MRSSRRVCGHLARNASRKPPDFSTGAILALMPPARNTPPVGMKTSARLPATRPRWMANSDSVSAACRLAPESPASVTSARRRQLRRHAVGGADRPVEAHHAGAAEQRLGADPPAGALHMWPDSEVALAHRRQVDVAAFARHRHPDVARLDQRPGAEPGARPQHHARRRRPSSRRRRSARCRSSSSPGSASDCASKSLSSTISARPKRATVFFGSTTQGQLVSGTRSPAIGPASASIADRGRAPAFVDHHRFDGVVDRGEVGGVHVGKANCLAGLVGDQREARIGAADVADQHGEGQVVEMLADRVVSWAHAVSGLRISFFR